MERTRACRHRRSLRRFGRREAREASRRGHQARPDPPCGPAPSVCARAPPPPVVYAGSCADANYVASLKVKLLSVVSGLNRGLAASSEDLDRADAAARELEAAAGGPVDLNRDLDKLQVRWRLVYSSAFSSKTLGGSWPGPPTGALQSTVSGLNCFF
ncbi:plastid-lipid-associated protein 6, chloroplastic-like [Panicum virgatum]|uniref:Plastid lipid-associated protein/fibrillin conserved domain-containing protein n=1 Tax=Panicum virgatum TaxID=38727 RepID=A0A8T0PSE1_PANVG|nr:plastid-lipid-associated protein 6, chloroplastic-like [Panicum virgatum]KAG2565311.1 hypothetical protein PVAP13_7NG045700 [Panicum virgatum]